jgi:sugar phosphate isomerase/epimerase
MKYTRRDFGKMALAALPAASALSLPSAAFAAPNSRISGVQIGTITYSFKQDVRKPVEIIPDLVKIGLNSVELMSYDAELMAGAPPIPSFGSGVKLTSEQKSAIEEGQRKQRDWRAKTSAATYQRVRKMFDDAGINLDILCYNMGSNIADDEIDYAFRMAQAMKVGAISSSSTVAVARRVAPLADKYKIAWGGHGHTAVKDPNEFATPESFELIMSLSKYIGVNLDIGHYTAANYDPIPFIQKHHARITNLHLKDRKKNDGPNVPWGQGETPIKQVLQLMRKEKYPFPGNIELEYPIPDGSDSVKEIAKCYEFARKCLES